MAHHDLKTDRVPFLSMWNGDKKAEFRKNDRDFKVGDTVTLHEQVHVNNLATPTGFMLIGTITHVLKDSYGIPDGYAMLSISITGRGRAVSSAGIRDEYLL